MTDSQTTVLSSSGQSRSTWREKALVYAAMMREGLSGNEIARQHGLTRQAVNKAMQRACPIQWPNYRHVRRGRAVWVVRPGKAIEPDRPTWSYPDSTTIALAHEIRREIQRASAQPFRGA